MTHFKINQGRVVSITNPRGKPMLLIMDGSYIDFDILQNTPPRNVEGIEILKPGVEAAIYGTDGYWGVVIITTKKGGTDVVDTTLPNVGHSHKRLRGRARVLFSCI